MMQEMMKHCCTEDGKPDFEQMKQLMEHCGKQQFSEDQLGMMKQFCDQAGVPDMSKVRQLMESCCCHVPEAGRTDQSLGIPDSSPTMVISKAQP